MSFFKKDLKYFLKYKLLFVALKYLVTFSFKLLTLTNYIKLSTRFLKNFSIKLKKVNGFIQNFLLFCKFGLDLITLYRNLDTFDLIRNTKGSFIFLNFYFNLIQNKIKYYNLIAFSFNLDILLFNNLNIDSYAKN